MKEDLDKTSKENVIKALQCCTADLAKYALVTIKRLDAENKRLKRYDEERDIALHARLIDNTRAEVARKIFAEIEKCRVVGVYGVHCYLMADVDEIKKKYTEVANNDG